jgi:hypothetical protein
MRKRDIIVSAVKARVRRTTHKYGIEMPAIGRNRDDVDVIRNVAELDKKNGDMSSVEITHTCRILHKSTFAKYSWGS